MAYTKGIIFAGNSDRIEEELAEIKEEQGQRIAKSEIKNRKSLRKQKNYGVIIL